MSLSQRRLVIGSLIVAVAAAGAVFAENPGLVEFDPWEPSPVAAAPDAQPKWGVDDATSISIPTIAFNGYEDTDQSAIRGFSAVSSYRYCNSTCYLWAPIYPVHGSTPNYVAFKGYDADASGNVVCQLMECPGGAVDCTSLVQFGTTDPYVGGYFSSSSVVAPALTFDTEFNAYAARCRLRGGTSDTMLGTFEVVYFLQISAAPVIATFADVPVGAFGFQHVEALAASGITSGCGGGNYCPNQPLTRVQMAVFLAKALGLHWSD